MSKPLSSTDVADPSLSGEFHAASQEPSPSLAAEFVLFLRENQTWWMLPILLVLALLTGLILMSGSGAAPFIYSLF